MQNGYCKRAIYVCENICNESSYEFYDNGADQSSGGLTDLLYEKIFAGFKKIVKDKVPVKRWYNNEIQTRSYIHYVIFDLFGTILIFLFEYHNQQLWRVYIYRRYRHHCFNLQHAPQGLDAVRTSRPADACISARFLFLMIIGGSPTVPSQYRVISALVFVCLCGKTRRTNYSHI